MGHLRPAIVLIAFFTVLTGLALPLGYVGLGAALFPHQAGGSLVEGKGSALIGQNFTADKYFSWAAFGDDGCGPGGCHEAGSGAV